MLMDSFNNNDNDRKKIKISIPIRHNVITFVMIKIALQFVVVRCLNIEIQFFHLLTFLMQDDRRYFISESVLCCFTIEYSKSFNTT